MTTTPIVHSRQQCEDMARQFDREVSVLTQEERVIVLGKLLDILGEKYCMHCLRLDPMCRCWDDS